jgi:hypothetical protein
MGAIPTYPFHAEHASYAWTPRPFVAVIRGWPAVYPPARAGVKATARAGQCSSP